MSDEQEEALYADLKEAEAARRKAEAERDEARALYREAEERYANEVRAHDKTTAERDEARAQIAKKAEIHDIQHRLIIQESEARAKAEADAARLREALELAFKHGWNGQHSSLCFSGEPYTGCTCPPWVQQARAAIACKSDEVKR